MLTQEEKEYLLNLAQKAIENFLEEKTIYQPDLPQIPENLKEKQAAFVTLKKEGKLRGCIGSLLPTKPLWQEVIENAIKAAFFDPRFNPLEKGELKNLEIEISILSPLKKVSFSSKKELIEFLEKEKPGVLLKSGIFQATFLPQVWEELPKAEDFLFHLSMKAGLPPEAWQNPETEFFIYQVESFQKKYKN